MTKPSKNGIITLDNMPNEYVQLKSELLYEIVNKASKIAGSLLSLSKLTGVKYSKLIKFHQVKDRQKSLLLDELKKLSKFLVANSEVGYNLNELEIESIGKYQGINQPKFPINFQTCEGACLIADTLTDGCINIRDRVSYTNSDPLQIVNNLKQINLLFCKYYIKVLDEELRNLSDKSNCLTILKELAKRSKINARVYIKEKIPKLKLVYSIDYTDIAGRILESLNIPKGRRVYTNPKLPDFLFLSPEKLISKFFERIIINEGSVSNRKIEIFHSIDVTNFLNEKSARELKKILVKKKLIPQLLLDYIKLLKSVGCKSSKPRIKKIYFTKENETRVNWKIMLTGQSLEILRKNFDLEAAINKKLFPLLERESMELHLPQEERLEQITNVFKASKTIKSYEIASKIGLSPSSTIDYLKMLREKGKINVIRNRFGTAYKLAN